MNKSFSNIYLQDLAHPPEKKSSLCHIHFRLLRWQINAGKFSCRSIFKKSRQMLWCSYSPCFQHIKHEFTSLFPLFREGRRPNGPNKQINRDLQQKLQIIAIENKEKITGIHRIYSTSMGNLFNLDEAQLFRIELTWVWTIQIKVDLTLKCERIYICLFLPANDNLAETGTAPWVQLGPYSGQAGEEKNIPLCSSCQDARELTDSRHSCSCCIVYNGSVQFECRSQVNLCNTCMIII